MSSPCCASHRASRCFSEGVVEFLVMNDALRRAVMRHAGMGELEQLAGEAGMRTMYQDGIAKALAGLTTIEEVLRVSEDA